MRHEVAIVAAHPSDQVQDAIGIDDLDSSLPRSFQSILNAPEVARTHVAKPTESYEISGRHVFITPMWMIQFDLLGGIAFTPAAADKNDEPLFEIISPFEVLENLID